MSIFDDAAMTPRPHRRVVYEREPVANPAPIVRLLAPPVPLRAKPVPDGERTSVRKQRLRRARQLPRLIELFNAGLSRAEICRKMKLSNRTVDGDFQAAGLVYIPRVQGRTSGVARRAARRARQKAMLIEVFASGATCRDIAAKVGVTDETVREDLKALGVDYSFSLGGDRRSALWAAGLTIPGSGVE